MDLSAEEEEANDRSISTIKEEEANFGSIVTVEEDGENSLFAMDDYMVELDEFDDNG